MEYAQQFLKYYTPTRATGKLFSGASPKIYSLLVDKTPLDIYSFRPDFRDHLYEDREYPITVYREKGKFKTIRAVRVDTVEGPVLFSR